MLATAFYSGLRTSGLTAITRLARRGGVILCYHNIVDARAAAGEPGRHLDIERFRAQCAFLAKHYAVIPMGEFVGRVRSRRSMRGVATITCDDAYCGALGLAWPILRDLGLPATVFVPTGERAADGSCCDAPAGSGPLPATHRRATWAQITEAAREGCELGVHTRSHRNLVGLAPEDLRMETRGSRDELAERTGVDARCFSYPYGLYDVRAREAVRSAGFDSAVTLEFGLNGRDSDPYALRRINVPASIGEAAFESWVAGVRRLGETT